MKEVEYMQFSQEIHDMKHGKIIECQIELTYRCPITCRHCYLGCVKKNLAKADELSSEQVYAILEKLRDAGVLWLNLTGGDPLMRGDFAQIYERASDMGFIVTVLSELAQLPDDVLLLFQKKPPFRVRVSVNAATKQTYNDMTGCDFFSQQIENINKLMDSGINVETTTLITKRNVHEVKAIRELVEGLGCAFKPTTVLFAQFGEGDAPQRERLEPEEALRVLLEEYTLEEIVKGDVKDCDTKKGGGVDCAILSSSVVVDASGKMHLCTHLRLNGYELLKDGSTVEKGYEELSRQVKDLEKDSGDCDGCSLSWYCMGCAGQRFNETGSHCQPSEYFCRLAELLKDKVNKSQ